MRNIEIKEPQSMITWIKWISQLYKPGFPRPPEPFITQKILHETLQQNLLLPVNIPNTASSNISAPQNDSPYNVFSNTYLSNRSAGVVPSYSDGVDTRNYNKGMMAGTAIEDLEYQDGSMLDHRTAHGGPIPKVINFEDDRSRYSQSRKDAGFDSNIPRGTGDTILSIEISSSITPAFAKANKGIIPKAT